MSERVGTTWLYPGDKVGIHEADGGEMIMLPNATAACTRCETRWSVELKVIVTRTDGAEAKDQGAEAT